MSVVEEKEAKTLTRKSVYTPRQEPFGLDKRVLAAHPGDRIGFSVRINGPPRHVVSVEVRGIPSNVAEVSVSPYRAIAPYTAEVSLAVRGYAEPGLYPFTVVINNITIARPIGVEKLGLLILPRELSLSQYARLRRIYYREKLGAQGVLWYLIAKVYKNGASFMKLKRVYEFIRGGPVRKATIAKILKQMIKKGLIKKGEDGKYHPLVTRGEIVVSRIDRKRVRIQKLSMTIKRRKEASTRSKHFQETYITKLAFMRAKKLALEYNSLVAAYFLAYTLIGMRETGLLLFWLNNWFIFCEMKTGFCHHFYSALLHRYFQLLGLKQGIQYRPSQEHEVAKRIADKYVKKFYGSHQSSRRLHYELKQRRLIEYEDEVYTLEILYYDDSSIGLRIWDNNMEEVEYEENITDKLVAKREIKPAFPYEHVYQPNEETYFHRPAGLY